MSQCEKTENQAEQDKSHTVAGIEAHPTPPHCCFFRNDRCNLAHADLQCGVTGRELWPPERIHEVDDSERKVNARTNLTSAVESQFSAFWADKFPRFNKS